MTSGILPLHDYPGRHRGPRTPADRQLSRLVWHAATAVHSRGTVRFHSLHSHPVCTTRASMRRHLYRASKLRYQNTQLYRASELLDF